MSTAIPRHDIQEMSSLVLLPIVGSLLSAIIWIKDKLRHIKLIGNEYTKRAVIDALQVFVVGGKCWNFLINMDG